MERRVASAPLKRRPSGLSGQPLLPLFRRVVSGSLLFSGSLAFFGLLPPGMLGVWKVESFGIIVDGRFEACQDNSHVRSKKRIK